MREAQIRETPEPVRLQKWLARMGLASRREAERMILEKRIKVNGTLAQIGQSITPNIDKIALDNKNVSYRPPASYWLFHKPRLYLCSKKSDEGKPTIFDIPSLRRQVKSIFTVGRLDYLSEGLLLLTNDGDLCHQLCHPSFEVKKVYHVLSNRILSKQELDTLNAEPIQLEDGSVKIKIDKLIKEKLGNSSGCWYRITLTSGKNRVIRRIFERLDARVLRLVRVSYADITLSGDSKPGDLRQLTENELHKLKLGG